MQLERVFSIEHDRIAVWRNVVIQMTVQTITVGGIQACSNALAELAVAHPGGVGLISIPAHRMPLPDSSARKATKAMFERLGPSLRGAAYVFTGGGFWSGAVRSVLTSVALSASAAMRVQAFDDRLKAGNWLTGVLAATWPAEELLAAIETLEEGSTTAASNG